MMNKKEFIELYVVNFMSCFDANHILHVGDSEILSHKCKYKDALRHAENSYCIAKIAYDKDNEVEDDEDDEDDELTIDDVVDNISSIYTSIHTLKIVRIKNILIDEGYRSDPLYVKTVVRRIAKRLKDATDKAEDGL